MNFPIGVRTALKMTGCCMDFLRGKRTTGNLSIGAPVEAGQFALPKQKPCCVPLALVLRSGRPTMDLIYRAVLLCVLVLAGALLLSPYESFLEGTIAIIIVTAVAVGFLMFPRKDVFYVRTTVKSIVASGPIAEHDYVAVKVELARLWLLFLPAFLAVAFLVVPATRESCGDSVW